MDIDSPPSIPDTPPPSGHPGHTHLNLPTFSSSFPLAFRVLFLVGLAQLLWAVNLHILHLLGLDTAWILDFRDRPRVEEIGLEDVGGGRSRESGGVGGAGDGERPSSGKLYQPVYRLFGLYTAWVGGGWVLFRLITGAETEEMEKWRGLVGVVGVGAAVGALAPWRGVGERERGALRSAVKRILLPATDSPIFFCDVILADILTSFAKVLGDLWISSCQIWNGGITQGRVRQSGWANYITLAAVCFPYLVRFRQCLLEAHQSSYSNPRPLANALKYFSAFPVILLSAAQKNVITDIAREKGVTVQYIKASGDRWFGEHRLFRLWLLSVVVNSLYSFWWDVKMDWGLRLCDMETWFGRGTSTSADERRRNGSGEIDLTLGGRIASLWRRASGSSPGGSPMGIHQRSPCPTPTHRFESPMSSAHSSPGTPPTPRGFFAFGLRPILLLPDPLVYHIFTAIDLILRLTWSLKLSSHLHTISEIESGVFLMEALELFRRWMWVFVRVEWEAVKMSEARGWRGARDRERERERGAVLWEEEEKA